MVKENLIGQVFAGRFQVTGFLGEGGMGRIYLANEVDASRQVALKLLHPHLGGDAEVIGRFNREMKLAAQVEHPNTVRVYEYGETAGRLFLSMEFVDGESLAEVIQEAAPFPPERVAFIGRQIAAALGTAHSRGIVHRDLKPDNVMIEKPGERDIVKVCDFGLARFVGGDDSADGDTDEEGKEDEGDFHTAIGIRVGTPHYMSPEYIAHFEADHRADIYALGVLLYEMATGKPPFDGRPFEVFEAALKQKPKPPSSVVTGIPPWLDRVILKLLEKDPARRPQVAEEVVVMLERDRTPDGADVTEEATGRAAAAPTRLAGKRDVPAKGSKTIVMLLVGFLVAMLVGGFGLVCLSGAGLMLAR